MREAIAEMFKRYSCKSHEDGRIALLGDYGDELAKQDILPFLKDSQKLEIWSKPFFLAVSDKIQYKSQGRD